MIVSLKPHPECPPSKPLAIEVTALRPAPRNLALTFRVSGLIGDLRIPPGAAPTRRDGLWQHTCFEAFVHEPGEPEYREYNFSPSTEWAAYRFDGYRSGMEAVPATPPDIETSVDAAMLQLRVMLDLPTDRPLLLGLSAVIEEQSGRKSYWALAHPADEPDFHHPDGFVLELPAS